MILRKRRSHEFNIFTCSVGDPEYGGVVGSVNLSPNLQLASGSVFVSSFGRNAILRLSPKLTPKHRHAA